MNPALLPDRYNNKQAVGAGGAHSAQEETNAHVVDVMANVAVTDPYSFFTQYLGAVGSSQPEHKALVAEHPTAESVGILDCGATLTCLMQGYQKTLLPKPVRITGAGKGSVINCDHSVTIPCLALGCTGKLTGVYSPNFNHNLISLRSLQK